MKTLRYHLWAALLGVLFLFNLCGAIFSEAGSTDQDTYRFLSILMLLCIIEHQMVKRKP